MCVVNFNCVIINIELHICRAEIEREEESLCACVYVRVCACVHVCAGACECV